MFNKNSHHFNPRSVCFYLPDSAAGLAAGDGGTRSARPPAHALPALGIASREAASDWSGPASAAFLSAAAALRVYALIGCETTEIKESNARPQQR